MNDISQASLDDAMNDSCIKERILFIGEFPPPYTGVTIKDVALCDQLLSGFDVKRFDLYRFKHEKARFPILVLQLLAEIKKADRICIGVGHPFRMCMIFRIAKTIRGEEFLSKITVFMMGIGTPSYLRSHSGCIPLIAKGNRVFVEGHSLVDELNNLGILNAEYLPNFRDSYSDYPPRSVRESVKFVYFARVCAEKGADTLLKAVRELNDKGMSNRFELDIWGQVAPEFASEFNSLVEPLLNVQYRGAFDAEKNNVFKLLNSYDSSISSSSWREGMSGTNIESKFAGIANIVGDGGLNAESVENGVDGFVVPAGDVDALEDVMRLVIEDHTLLEELKHNSFLSRTDYSLSQWKDRVISSMGLCEVAS